MELDKQTILTIHDIPPREFFYKELLDFDDGEVIYLHDIEGISGKYHVKRRKHELISFPHSPDCLSRNYDLFPAKK